MLSSGGKNSNPFVIQEGRYGNLDSANHLKWAEESFVSEIAAKGKFSDHFHFRIFSLFSLALIFLFFFLFSRVAWLQIAKGDYYYSLAEGNRIRFERTEPKRGVIYDRNGIIFARNVANFMLYEIPGDLPEDGAVREKIANRIIEILEPENADEIKNEIEVAGDKDNGRRPVFLADNITYEKAIKLYLESEYWPGIVLSSRSRREYSFSGSSLSHILGYTGKISEAELKKYGSEYLPIDYVGKSGVESFYENRLRGKGGERQIEVDAFGKEKKVLAETKAQDGANLTLTIDSEVQNKLEEIILGHLRESGMSRASGIITDPNNGEILALVNVPFYDNNVFARGIKQNEYEVLVSDSNQPLFNRAISGEYPSGSTIKPVIASAALQEKIITKNTTFFSAGGLRILSWFFPDYLAGGHGITDVKKAIADSVNTFFYYIGGGYGDFAGLGVDRITSYCRLFGLGAQTGIDLPNESSGFLPTKEWKEEAKNEAWYIGDTYHLAIGQGDLLVTPLQVAIFTGVFANGGKLNRPHLVKTIEETGGRAAEEQSDFLIRENFISEKNIEIVREGMRQTITSGSGRSLLSLPVASAGKTGTAQWSTVKKPHAWFTGFAPYENPRITITIMVEEGEEGSRISTQIAKDFLAWYFSGRKTDKKIES